MREPAFFAEHFDQLGLNATTRRFILEHHMSESRHYHGLGHLALMIRHLEFAWSSRNQYITGSYQRELDRIWPSMLMAIFFHDVIYDATAPKNQNEEMSVVAMKLHAPHGFDTALAERMILATRDHHIGTITGVSSWDDRAVAAFLIADLHILWHPKATTYAWYARGVRKEYAWVPNDKYREGRAAVLDTLYRDLVDCLSSKECSRFTRNIAWEKDQLASGALDV